MNQPQENPYLPPQSEVGGQTDPGMLAPRIGIYSPNQVKAGAFLGGPLAAVYLLKSNYEALEKRDLASLTLWIGLGGTLLLIALLSVVPEHFPKMVIPLAYSLGAGYFASEFQVRKDAISASERLTFQSNWKVVGVSLLGIVVFLVIAIAFLFLMGMVKPGQ